jgi:hypothetical protein
VIPLINFLRFFLDREPTVEEINEAEEIVNILEEEMKNHD